MNKLQHTIKKAITIQGVGLHTGKQVSLTFRPAAPNQGIQFKRVDLDNQPTIRADIDYVVEVQRGTTLSHKNVTISTVEHVMAALAGLEVDNVLIEIDSQELPIMDGSAKPFVDALLSVGLAMQNVAKEYFALPENIHFYDEQKGSEILAVPADDYQLVAMIDFNSPVLGKQHASLKKLSDFKDQIASARTFCFLHELELLLKHNLIKGGDLSNAIVVVDKPTTEEELNRLANLFGKEKVGVRREGYLNNVELRHQNEPARHKLLDVIGDIALIGIPIQARIIASKPGHSTNVAFAKKLKKLIKKNRQLIGAPRYIPTQPSVYDVNKIMATLPHRYPFLLVDKIIELSSAQVVGIKNVTLNEPFFQGHFPQNPIMPGVLVIEAMAQTGGILLLETVSDPQNYETYFLKIEQARFRNKVVPGDTLVFKLSLIGTIRRGLCEMRAVAYVGNKIAAEAILTAQIRRKRGK